MNTTRTTPLFRSCETATSRLVKLSLSLLFLVSPWGVIAHGVPSIDDDYSVGLYEQQQQQHHYHLPITTTATMKAPEFFTTASPTPANAVPPSGTGHPHKVGLYPSRNILAVLHAKFVQPFSQIVVFVLV